MRAQNTVWGGLGRAVLQTLTATTRMAIGFAAFGEGAGSFSLTMCVRMRETCACLRDQRAFVFLTQPCSITTYTLTKSIKASIHRGSAGEGYQKNPSQPSPKATP